MHAKTVRTQVEHAHNLISEADRRQQGICDL